MFVIPKPGLVFRDPHSRVRVPPEGMEVPDGSLEWARILADGDAEIGTAPVEPTPAPETPKKAKVQPAAGTDADGAQA